MSRPREEEQTVSIEKPAHHLIAEVPCRYPRIGLTIGVDLGNVWSHYCTLDQDGGVVDRGRFRTTSKAINKAFKDLPPTRVSMEAGVHRSGLASNLRNLGFCEWQRAQGQNNLAVLRKELWGPFLAHYRRVIITVQLHQRRISVMAM
jgi:hypothetical protein